jgi:hypothetical protein
VTECLWNYLARLVADWRGKSLQDLLCFKLNWAIRVGRLFVSVPKPLQASLTRAEPWQQYKEASADGHPWFHQARGRLHKQPYLYCYHWAPCVGEHRRTVPPPPPSAAPQGVAEGRNVVYLSVWAQRVVWAVRRVDWAKREKNREGASEVGRTQWGVGARLSGLI